jgi:hypothetical protein
VTDERRRLLEAIGSKGADADQLSELGAWAIGELERALAEDDVTLEPMQPMAETTGTRFAADPPLIVYKLTEQGSRKIGLDPNTLV